MIVIGCILFLINAKSSEPSPFSNMISGAFKITPPRLITCWSIQSLITLTQYLYLQIRNWDWTSVYGDGLQPPVNLNRISTLKYDLLIITNCFTYPQNLGKDFTTVIQTFSYSRFDDSEIKRKLQPAGNRKLRACCRWLWLLMIRACEMRFSCNIS